MKELFDVILVNKSQFKADETYVEFDTDGFTKIPVRLVTESFESMETPGKHDGAKVIQTVLELYETSVVLV
jgi:hypothetical protein